MDISVNKRLKEFLKDKESNQKELAEYLGLKEQQVSKWFTLKEQIPEKHFIKIIRFYPALPARWFITGEGQMETEGFDLVKEPKPNYINNDCCSRCKDLENQIELYKKLLSVYENPPKKETTNEDSTQHGEDAKGKIAG